MGVSTLTYVLPCDDLDRVIEKKYNNDSTKKLNYYYNSQGNISAIVDYMSGTTTRYVYDFCGRVVEIRENNGTDIASHLYTKSSKYTYADKTNYITKVEYLENGQTRTVEYEYGSLDSGTMPDAVYGVKLDGAQQLTYTYDNLGRLSTRKIVPANLQRTYTYLQGGYGVKSTTALVKSYTEDYVTTQYTYDALGNITHVYMNGTLYEQYRSDALNQMIAAFDTRNGWHEYTYQNGNITSVSHYGEPVKSYTYGDTSWKDLLTAYNGQTITYDAIGNPLQYRDGMNFTWSNGRQLSAITKGTDNISYTYDAEGIRTSKTVNGVTTTYSYLNGVLYSQTTGTDTMYFLYDEIGEAYGFIYNGTTYYYSRNIQGDVLYLYTSSGMCVAGYIYDTWGKLVDVDGAGDSYIAIANANPIRYRGYYYDNETGFYYLQSRYYDPETGRFISADGLVDQSSVLGYNLFAYCRNNPVNMTDTTGNLPFFAITAAIGAVVGAVVGGVVAAKNGGNVWAGVGIGAAAGALIGTGAGMAAGAALAGSITATTGAVMAGGSTLVATVGAGGLGAGATYIANNLSQAANNLAPAAQTAASKMQEVATKGKAGEALSGLAKNTSHIPSLTGTASYRIPDGLDAGMRILSEVKNYSGTLSYTNQLKDFVMWSQANGYQMHLYTNATLTGPLQQVVDSGIIQLFPLG